MNESKKICLIYKRDSISYNIAFFNSIEEAEHWRNFLAFTVKEYQYEDMQVLDTMNRHMSVEKEKMKSRYLRTIINQIKHFFYAIYFVLFIESKHRYD